MIPESKPKAGQIVILNDVPPGLRQGLPGADQIAIAEAVGTRVLLLRYDDDGRAELEFTDKNGIIHAIFVDPAYVSKP